MGLLITLSDKGVHFGVETHELSDWVFACLTLEDSNLSILLIAFLLDPVAIEEVEFVNVSPQVSCFYF